MRAGKSVGAAKFQDFDTPTRSAAAKRPHRMLAVRSPVPIPRLVAEVVYRRLVPARPVAAAVRRQDVFRQLRKFRVALHREPVVRLPRVGRAARLQAVVDGLAADVTRGMRCLVAREALLAQSAPFLGVASCSRHVILHEITGGRGGKCGERPRPLNTESRRVFRRLSLIKHDNRFLGAFWYST